MSATVSGCLDEDDVLAFVGGSLDGERRDAVLGHLDTCEGCRALASTLARDEDVRNERTTSEPPPSQDDIPVGGLVDARFRLLGSLGRGAMGTVYRAVDEKLGTEVALKLLHTGGGPGDARASARAFARELNVGRRVTHQNVCRLHDAGELKAASYITMELVEGETLAAELARGRLAPERAEAILAGVAAGLAAVHVQGIVHRDLKPANVMIERTSHRPVLTDFGFATELRGEHSRRLVGTPLFWAPEQARGETPTPASDVYSFGLLAYRLIAGRAYSLSDPTALGRLPASWRGFVARCLEPRPADRFPDAGAIVRALERRKAGPARFVRPALAVVVGAAVVASLVYLPRHPSAAPEGAPKPSISLAEPISAPSAQAPHASADLPPSPAPPTTAAPEKTSPPREDHAPGATGHRNAHLPTVSPSKPVATPPAPPSSSRQDDPLYRH